MTIRGRELRPSMTGIKCPACGHQTSTVKDSRPTDDHTAIRRRRMCLKCGARATTYERFGAEDATARNTDLLLAFDAIDSVHQRRLIENLIRQIAADDRRAREATDIAERVEADDRPD